MSKRKLDRFDTRLGGDWPVPAWSRGLLQESAQFRSFSSGRLRERNIVPCISCFELAEGEELETNILSQVCSGPRAASLDERLDGGKDRLITHGS
jgi:hypothetical protein